MKTFFVLLATLAGCCAADPTLPNLDPGPAPECAEKDAGATLCPAFNVPCEEPSDCCVLLDGAPCSEVSLYYTCGWCCDATEGSDIRELSCLPVP